MIRFIKPLLCVAATIIAANADAAVLTFTGSTSAIGNPTIEFARLASGTLNSVAYEVRYNAVTSFGTTDPNPGTIAYTGNVGSSAFGFVDFGGTTNVSGPGIFSVGGSGTTSGILTTDLGRFVGTGLFSALVTSNVVLTNSSSTGIGRGNASASYTITYDYTPAVPEPATWAMMVAGMTLAAAMMRRRYRGISFQRV